MNTWRHRLFARNEFNFWGWLFAGLLIFGVVLAASIAALPTVFLELPEGRLDAQLLVLIAILLVLSARFALALQEFHARWVEANPPATDQQHGP